MIQFTNLAQPLQDFLADPRSSVFVVDFLKRRRKDSTEKINKVSSLIFLCIYGDMSIDDMLLEVETFCELNEVDSSHFFQEFLEILGEEGLDEIEKYPINRGYKPITDVFEHNPTPSTPQRTQTLERNPEVVQSKLLQALDSFNLHVDEKGIIAHEVERYLKGEVFSKDLVPHLTALLDKPLSEIKTIIESLNEIIFKPIQKQIAEEGTIDISYGDDTSLHNFLIQKKGTSTNSSQDETFLKKEAAISFIPKSLQKTTVEQTKIDEIASDLRAQGGTPSGTSLLSQEMSTSKNYAKPESSVKPAQQKYSVDPYREIPE